MNKLEESFFEFLKEYRDEPNVPDLCGEYPVPYELTIEDAELILNVKERQQQELERYKNIIDELETYLQRKYCEYIDMESDEAFVIGLVLDTLRELKGE